MKEGKRGVLGEVESVGYCPKGLKESSSWAARGAENKNSNQKNNEKGTHNREVSWMGEAPSGLPRLPQKKKVPEGRGGSTTKGGGVGLVIRDITGDSSKKKKLKVKQVTTAEGGPIRTILEGVTEGSGFEEAKKPRDICRRFSSCEKIIRAEE